MLIQGFFNYLALLNRIRIGKSMLYQGFSMNCATPGNYIRKGKVLKQKHYHWKTKLLEKKP